MRPLSFGELLDTSFAAVRRNFGTLVLCTLIIVVPLAIIDTLIQTSTTDFSFDFSTKLAIYHDRTAYVAGLIVSRLLQVVGTLLATAACLRALGGAVMGDKVDARTSLGYAARRFGPLLLVAFLYLLTLIGGLVLCIVGVVWTWVLFVLASPAVLFEDQRGTGALRRSKDLIAGHWWRVFGALLVMYIIVFVLQAVIIALLGGVVLANSDNETLNAILVTVGEIVSRAISLPLLAAVTTYIYFDLRVRKEGFDLQLLAQRIGPEGTGAPAAAPPVEGLPGADAPSDAGFLPPQSQPPAA